MAFGCDEASGLILAKLVESRYGWTRFFRQTTLFEYLLAQDMLRKPSQFKKVYTAQMLVRGGNIMVE